MFSLNLMALNHFYIRNLRERGGDSEEEGSNEYGRSKRDRLGFASKLLHTRIRPILASINRDVMPAYKKSVSVFYD